MTLDQFRNKYGTDTFRLLVQRAVECNGIIPEDIYNALTEALDDLEDVLEGKTVQ